MHAGAMIGATVAALGLGAPSALAAVALLSFLALLWLGRGHYTDGRGFGVASYVTTIRLGIVLALLAFTKKPDAESALWVVLVLVLDAIDGWLARRRGLVSDFGERFDMECDAFLLLACGVLLAVDGRLGVWIVAPGLLRYLYVLLLAVLPARGEAPRSRHGRHVFGFVVLSLAASLWPIEPVHAPLAMLATAALCASFGHSLWWSLRGR